MKKLLTLCAILAMAAIGRADMTYAPFLIGAGNDAAGVPIANGTYVMVADLDGDGFNGTPYTGQSAGTDNSGAWLWDADDLLMARGQIVDGTAYPFYQVATADIPAGYTAGVDRYYVLWFVKAYNAADAGPGVGVAYGVENLGPVGSNPGDYTPFLTGGSAVLTTVEGGAGGNNAPVLAAVGNRNVDEGSELAFVVTASDPNDTPPNGLTLSATGLPAGASFDPGTGNFAWTPGENQDGTHEVTFTVTDDGTPNLDDSETITITVAEVNQAPVLDPIGPKAVDEGTQLAFAVAATDADLPANSLTFSATGLPAGATLDGVTGAFAWTPAANQQGSHQITFTVEDDGTPVLSDSEVVTVTVNDVGNRAPVATPPAAATVAQGSSVTVPLAAEDPDGDAVTVVIVDGPAGGTLGAVDQGAQTVLYTPTPGFSGQDHFTFKATDGRLDSTVVHAYVYVIGADGWLVQLTTDTGEFPALYFGADTNATDGYDADFDELLPGEIVPTRAIRNFAGIYRPAGAETNPAYFLRDVRQVDGDYFWVVELESFEGDLNVAWDVASLPAGIPLRITACDVLGLPLVPGDVGTLMSDISSVSVSFGDGIKRFRIDRVDGEIEFLLTLDEGWNLISIPLQPLDPRVDTIFADTKIAGRAERSFRDGGRGRITSGEVWDWKEDTQSYGAVAAVEPYEGYWVYVEEGLGSMEIRVSGLPVPEPQALCQHWNLRGVGAQAEVDGNPGIARSIFYWLNNSYFKTTTLIPGFAYWLYSFDEGTNLR